jgi:lipoyl(octanoyl) transferase
MMPNNSKNVVFLSIHYLIMDYINWGTIRYKEAWDLQQKLFDERIKAKNDKITLPDLLVFCEHLPVFTLGKSGLESNLLVKRQELLDRGVEYYHSDRGGDITYHGPGQIICYPILDLEHLGLGLKKFLYGLEDAVILFLAEFGVKGERINGATGVWVCQPDEIPRKICAMGVRSSHFITMHGLALNINTDLSYYSMIHPCGFVDKGVTSLQVETGKTYDMETCSRLLFEKLSQVLNSEQTL